MKRIFLIILLLVGLGSGSMAQRHMKLTLRYDALIKRFSVLGKPDFTESRFIWGPSQITVVIPANGVVKKLRVFSVSGGSWVDESTIYHPHVQPWSDFHGMGTSNGEARNVVSGKELVVFYFTLPANIDPKGVRLFVNETDPNSSQEGMAGSDFWNTIIDRVGAEVFAGLYTSDSTGVAPPPVVKDSIDAFDVKIYPNVVTEYQFRLVVSGEKMKPTEVLLVTVTDEMGREVLRVKGTSRSLARRRLRLPYNTSGKIITVRVIAKEGTVSKRIVVR